MGQYFAPVIIDRRENPAVRWWFSAHVYGNGLKLMEHSYVGNGFVRAVETFLRLDGGMRLVWAGDYADGEPDGRNLWQQTLRGGYEDYSRSVVIPSGVEALYGGHAETLNRIVAASRVVDVSLAQPTTSVGLCSTWTLGSTSTQRGHRWTIRHIGMRGYIPYRS